MCRSVGTKLENNVFTFHNHAILMFSLEIDHVFCSWESFCGMRDDEHLQNLVFENIIFRPIHDKSLFILNRKRHFSFGPYSLSTNHRGKTKAYFNSKTLKRIFEGNLYINCKTRRDVTTSKIPFL